MNVIKTDFFLNEWYHRPFVCHLLFKISQATILEPMLFFSIFSLQLFKILLQHSFVLFSFSKHIYFYIPGLMMCCDSSSTLLRVRWVCDVTFLQHHKLLKVMFNMGSLQGYQVHHIAVYFGLAFIYIFFFNEKKEKYIINISFIWIVSTLIFLIYILFLIKEEIISTICSWCLKCKLLKKVLSYKCTHRLGEQVLISDL